MLQLKGEGVEGEGGGRGWREGVKNHLVHKAEVRVHAGAVIENEAGQ